MTVVPEARSAFDYVKSTAGITSDEEAMAAGILGTTMFHERHYGDCTASATFQANIFKALGIPTRIVVSVPIADANDPQQLAMAIKELHNDRIRKTAMDNIRKGVGSWVNHWFNEVYVGKRWVRLNYNNFGQGIVDSNYLGMMVQVAQVADWSEARLISWGINANASKHPPGVSVNPYRLVKISDNMVQATSNARDNVSVAVNICQSLQSHLNTR